MAYQRRSFYWLAALSRPTPPKLLLNFRLLEN